MPENWTRNVASVAAEQFGDETVIINFDTGRYFSLGGSAPWAWEALKDVASVASLGRALAPIAQSELAGLIAGLSREGLIVPAEGEAAPAPPSPDQWRTPTLEAFDDLAKLIAVDPVHEVDDLAGWPKRPVRQGQ